MIKAVFFDIDGTLVSFKTHKISESSNKTIKYLKEKGIKIFIASGRTLFQIDNLDDLEFDGYITMNECSCFINDNGNIEEISSTSFDKNDLLSLNDYLKTDRFLCTVITSDNMFINYSNDIIKDLYAIANFQVPKSIYLDDYITNNYKDILQLNIFNNSKSNRWHFSFADVNTKNSGKGIDKIIEYFDVDLSETMAFGDGGDDIGMIEHTAIGVAICNANDDAKKVADYITDDGYTRL